VRLSVEPFRLNGLESCLGCGGFSLARDRQFTSITPRRAEKGQSGPMLREYLSCANSGNPITLEQFMKAGAKEIFSAPKFCARLRTLPILLRRIVRVRRFGPWPGKLSSLPGTDNTATPCFSLNG